MTRVGLAPTSAGRSQKANNAGTKSRAAGHARRQYNRLRAMTNRRARALPDQTGQQEGEMLTHSWMHSKMDLRVEGRQNKVAYVQVKKMIERKLAHQKRGVINDLECKEMARDLAEERGEKVWILKL